MFTLSKRFIQTCYVFCKFIPGKRFSKHQFFKSDKDFSYALIELIIFQHISYYIINILLLYIWFFFSISNHFHSFSHNSDNLTFHCFFSFLLFLVQFKQNINKL
ncbi:hypothetical protein V8G54_019334 [Vigna mungo]|uniref:Uncharacterized protein n=1 Tax=Vigna mungo TaxID=3915 RepID=A0AAQ3RUV5_VIGMU